jgi:hypothetical protein
VRVRYKTRDGVDGGCVAPDEVCALGSPDYYPDLDALCGPARTAKVRIEQDVTVHVGDCLTADLNGGWEDTGARDIGKDHPAADCGAWVDSVQDGGQTLTSCRDTYPDTRMTFLAQLTVGKSPRGALPACLTVNMGA